MPTIDDRVHKLERNANRIIGGGLVAIVSILALFGITKWHEIPSAVGDAVPREVDTEVQSKVAEALPDAISEYVNTRNPDLIRNIEVLERRTKDAAEGAEATAGRLDELLDMTRANSQTLRIESGEVSFTARDNSPPGTRGISDGRITFNSTFVEVPEVMLSLTYLDHVRGANLRLKAVVKDVDNTGFSYDLLTWADTIIYRAKFSWIAYGY